MTNSIDISIVCNRRITPYLWDIVSYTITMIAIYNHSIQFIFFCGTLFILYGIMNIFLI